MDKLKQCKEALIQHKYPTVESRLGFAIGFLIDGFPEIVDLLEVIDGKSYLYPFLQRRMPTRREAALEYYPDMQTDPHDCKPNCPGDAFKGLPQSFDDMCPLMKENGAYDVCEKCWSEIYKGEPVKKEACIDGAFVKARII